MQRVRTLAAGVLLTAAGSATGADLDGDTVVLTTTEIQRLDVQTVVELLNRLPGVSATDSSVSLQGSASKHVLVRLDGRPLNDPNTGLVNLAGLAADNVAKLTVLKGSGAVRYGDNTTGGVVLIDTKASTDETPDKLEFYYGSHDTRRLHAELAGTASGTGLKLTLDRESTDGHRENNDGASRTVALDANRILAAGLAARVSLSYSKKDSDYAGKDHAPTPRARGMKHNRGALLKLDYRGVESRTYYNDFDKYYSNPDTPFESDLSSRVFGQEFKLPGPLPGGVKLERREAESNRFGTHKEDLYSAYALRDFTLPDPRFTTAVGLRVNQHSVFGTSYNPKLRVALSADGPNAALEVSRSSNTPSFQQRYYESTFTRASPGLDMERATNIKTALSDTATAAVSWSIALFHNEIEDAIAYMPNGDGTYSYRNIAASTRWGVDGSIDWTPVPDLRLSASYLYLEFTDDATGNYLPHKPRHKAKLTLHHSAGRLSTVLTANHVGDSYDNEANTDVLSGYTTLDGKWSYRLRATDLIFRVDNVLDEAYEVHPGYPAEGRTFTAGFSHRF